MPSQDFTDCVERLSAFFARPVCQRGMEPLKKGTEIAVYLAGEGPATLVRAACGPEVLATAPANPDMTFQISRIGLDELIKTQTEDVGEIGVAILRLMAHDDPAFRLQAKVHIGPFDLLRKGYLGVIPLGGATVMKFLASKGITSIGKIKDAIQRMKT